MKLLNSGEFVEILAGNQYLKNYKHKTVIYIN